MFKAIFPDGWTELTNSAASVMGTQAIPIDAQEGCSDPEPYEEGDHFLYNVAMKATG